MTSANTVVPQRTPNSSSPSITNPAIGFFLTLIFGFVGGLIALVAGSSRVKRLAMVGFAIRALGVVGLIGLALLQSKLEGQLHRVSTDACACAFELPRSMTDMPRLNAVADLRYGDTEKGLYLVDLVENRQDIAYASAAEYAARMKSNKDESPFVETTIGGFPAVKRTFTEHGAKGGGTNSHMVEAVIVTPDRIHHVLGWTVASQRERYGVDIDKMVSSFRAIE